MPDLKVAVRSEQKNSAGRCRILVRVSHNGQSRYISTSYYIERQGFALLLPYQHCPFSFQEPLGSDVWVGVGNLLNKIRGDEGFFGKDIINGIRGNSNALRKCIF